MVLTAAIDHNDHNAISMTNYIGPLNKVEIGEVFKSIK